MLRGSYSLFFSSSGAAGGGVAGTSPPSGLLSCFQVGCTGAAMGGSMDGRAISPGAC